MRIPLRLAFTWLLLAAASCALAAPEPARDDAAIGPGNDAARHVAGRSPFVRSALRFLVGQAAHIHDTALRGQTLDILSNPHACARHRAGLASDSARKAIVQQLLDAGLVNPADGQAFPGGAVTGVFPPVLQPQSECPKLPQPFFAAPGSGTDGHHSYPGGLVVHTANNETSDLNLAAQYEAVYGHGDRAGLPHVEAEARRADRAPRGASALDRDVLIAAPIWHDWAKSIVFQWNADGTEFREFNFGGNGSTDAWGAAGDSRTGGHHILSIAESMARRLSPRMVITQASAHAAPTLGNEYKVVNWLRAAAIIARVDPVQAGYLQADAQGRLRLAATGHLGDIDPVSMSQTNLRVEYALHNLSDSDFTFSIPAVSIAETLLKQLAPGFGYGTADTTTYNTRYRNPALSNLSAERLAMLYGAHGLDAVRRQLQALRARGVI